MPEEWPERIVIHCRFTVPFEHRDAWVESAREMAQKSRAEPGCLDYCFSFDLADPGVAYCYQEWASREQLDAHASSPHRNARMQNLASWDIGNDKIMYYRVASSADGTDGPPDVI